jgi:hypothetical protein
MRIRTIGQDFALEAPFLLPLPGDAFETGLAFNPRVDRYSMVAVRVCRYSVPVRYIGRTVHVLLRSNEVVVFYGRTEIARHPRLTTKGAERVVLDHFLEVLLAKPGALAGSEALDQARRTGTFTPAHEAFWSAAKHTLGESERTVTVTVPLPEPVAPPQLPLPSLTERRTARLPPDQRPLPALERWDQLLHHRPGRDPR